MSEEHIIPMAMGNEKFVINAVCEDCNNKLGHLVDDYFTNHIITRFIRKNRGWKGESGQDVKIFPNTAVDINTGDKFSFENDEPYLLPTVEVEDGKISIRSSNMDEAIKILKIKLKRLGIEASTIATTKKEGLQQSKLNSIQPVFNIDASMRVDKFFLLPIKIAFEYAVLKVGDKFLASTSGKKIQYILHRAISNNNLDIVDSEFILNHVQFVKCEAKKVLDNIKNFTSNTDVKIRHILTLHSTLNNELVCDIYMGLENVISFSVLLMDQITANFLDHDVYMVVILEDGTVISE